MSAIRKLIQQLQAENHYAIYFSIFRIFVGLYLLKDLMLNWDLIPLLYKGESFLPASPSILLELLYIDTDWFRSHLNFFFSFYAVTIILFLFGIGKNFTAFAVFLCLEINQRLCHIILNGGDNLLKFILLYMIFADCYRYFSINPKRNTNKDWQRISNMCTNLAGLSICIHLCWIYFVSAMHKTHADVWFNGIATYYTLSLERFSGTPLNETLAKSGLFVTLSTYFTLLIELFFPVLVWFKQTRWLLLIAGIMLHTSILILMMLYGFQTIFIMTYGFFITNREWKQFAMWLKGRVQKFKPLSDKLQPETVFTSK